MVVQTLNEKTFLHSIAVNLTVTTIIYWPRNKAHLPTPLRQQFTTGPLLRIENQFQHKKLWKKYALNEEDSFFTRKHVKHIIYAQLVVQNA